MSNALERRRSALVELAEAEKAHSCAVGTAPRARRARRSRSASSRGLHRPALPQHAHRRHLRRCRLPGRATRSSSKRAAEICKTPTAATRDAGPREDVAQRPARSTRPRSRRARPRRGARGGDERRVRVQADRRVQQGDRALQHVHHGVRHEERLNALAEGRPEDEDAPDPKKYTERIRFLGEAYDALGTTYYSFFNYQHAAETYEKVARTSASTEQKRKDAAKNAMILYANHRSARQDAREYRIVVKPRARRRTRRRTPTTSSRATTTSSGTRTARRPARTTRRARTRSARSRASTTRTRATARRRSTRSRPRAASRRMKKAVSGSESQGLVQEHRHRVGRSSRHANATEAKKLAVRRLRAPRPSSRRSTRRSTTSSTTRPATTSTSISTPKTSSARSTRRPASSSPKASTATTRSSPTSTTRSSPKSSRRTSSLEWVPAILARQGSLYDTLRTGLYNCGRHRRSSSSRRSRRRRSSRCATAAATSSSTTPTTSRRR